jgi:hypothetical protein
MMGLQIELEALPASSPCSSQASSATPLAIDSVDETIPSKTSTTTSQTVTQTYLEKRIAVIGAGAAGLAAAKNLKDQGFHHFTIYERNSTIGGTWIHSKLHNADIEPHNLSASSYGSVTSAIYDSLHTNLTPELMQYLDMPFPEGTERFMRHDVVLRYLRTYAEFHGLDKYVKFQTKVDKVEWDASKSKWRVGSSLLDFRTGVQDDTKNATHGNEELYYDAVIVATGHYYKPHLPTFPGLESFSGRIIHSRDYRNPQQGFSKKTVLVIGGGSSGIDIAREMAAVAGRTLLSLRRPDAVGDLGESLDVLGLNHNDNDAEKLDLVHNEDGVITNRKPVIEKKPRISRVSLGDIVEFEDGTTAKVDIILYCTGCKYLKLNRD